MFMWKSAYLYFSCVKSHISFPFMSFVKVFLSQKKLFRLTITASCPMDLQYFPMDSQLCYIEIESCKYHIIGFPNVDAIQSNKKFNPTLYLISLPFINFHKMPIITKKTSFLDHNLDIFCKLYKCKRFPNLVLFR